MEDQYVVYQYVVYNNKTMIVVGRLTFFLTFNRCYNLRKYLRYFYFIKNKELLI